MLTDEQLLSSPLVRTIAGRVAASGYAKTAAAVVFGKDTVSLPVMLASIGTKIAYDLYREQAIRSGLASLEALSDPEGLKQANFITNMLKRAPKANAAGAAEHSAVPAAERLTHAMPTADGGWGYAQQGMVDQLPPSFREYALELPAYARQVSEGGTFVPKEMPIATRPAPDAGAALKTKSRPTQQFDMPELPSMFQRSEGLGAPQRAINMGQGGKGIMAGGDVKPQGIGSFGAAQGSTEAPAMFNLAAMMGGKKLGSVFARMGVLKLAATAGVNSPAAFSALTHMANAGAGGAMGAGLGGITGGFHGYNTADEGQELEQTLKGILAGGTVGGLAGAGGGVLGAMGGRAMAGNRMSDPFEEMTGALMGSAAGGIGGGLAGSHMMQPKEAAINLSELTHALPGAESWRNAASFMPAAAAKAAPTLESAVPLSPRLRETVRGATAPSPFTSLQPVPSPDEIAAYMAKTKTAGANSVFSAFLGAKTAATPAEKLLLTNPQALKQLSHRVEGPHAPGILDNILDVRQALRDATGGAVTPELQAMSAQAGRPVVADGLAYARKHSPSDVPYIKKDWMDGIRHLEGTGPRDLLPGGV